MWGKMWKEVADWKVKSDEERMSENNCRIYFEKKMLLIQLKSILRAVTNISD